MPTTKCPGCKADVDTSRKFCPNCGNCMHVLCAQCGAAFRPGANFCGSCGTKLSHDAKPIKNMRWMCGPDMIARRIEEQDLEGIFRKGLVVEHGTRAIFLQEGRLAGILEPGFYTISTFKEKILSFNFSVPSTVILIRAADIELDFEIPRFFSKEEIELSVRCKMVQNVEKPEFFFTNLLQQRIAFSKSDLQRFLEQEMANVLQPLIRAESVKDLYANAELKKRIELALESEMRITLERSGLRLIQLRFIDYLSETLDKVRAEYPQHFILEEKEELEQKRRELATKILSRETMEELKKLRIETDKYNYLSEIDKEKLLTDHEKKQLADSIEDYELVRKFFVNRTKILNTQECERLINEFSREETKKDEDLKIATKREKMKLFDEFKKVILENKKIEQENKAEYISQLEERGPDALIAGMEPDRVSEYLKYLESKDKVEIEKAKAGAVFDEKTKELYEKMASDRDEMFKYVLDTLTGMRPTTTIVPGGGGSPWGGGPTVVHQESPAQPGGVQASGVCPNSECGRPVTPDEKFCSHCGAALA